MKLDEMAELMKLVVFCLPEREGSEGPDPTVHHEKGLVYGHQGGMDLTLDVFTPTVGATGKGLLFMISGGFFSTRRILSLSIPLIERLAHDYGYTVFAVQHGPQPRFVIAEIIPQVLRAVRFVRAHADRFGVDPLNLGIMGFSSGAHLSLMAGVHGDDGDPMAADPIERAASRVQAVVAFFPPTDHLNYGAPGQIDLGHGALKPLRESFVHKHHPPVDEEALGRLISPRYFVTAESAPTLLLHGDADPLVPLQQSQIFLEAMHWAGAECELRVKPGAGHGWTDLDPELEAAMAWFDRHLDVERELALKQ